MRPMLAALTDHLRRGASLTDAQVAQAVEALVDESRPATDKAEFLTALAQKGESPAEIAGFARLLREKAIAPPLDPVLRAGELLDVCGTGGDRLNTFNVSTTVAIVAAAAGLTVAKHGNRAITSKAGSADVLEALGIRIDLPPDAAARFLHEHGFAFFFAPLYHPAFKQIAPARKLCAERGQRTLFNFLGPLLNPVRPTAQLLGVPGPELCEPVARVLQSLGTRRAMVVCGAVPGGWFLDELSTLGDSTVAEFYQDRALACSQLERGWFDLQPATLDDLRGGDREANARVVRELLQGRDRGPRRDLLLLNAAAALWVGNRARSLGEGWGLAAALIDDGRAFGKLEELAEASRAVSGPPPRG